LVSLFTTTADCSGHKLVSTAGDGFVASCCLSDWWWSEINRTRTWSGTHKPQTTVWTCNAFL